MSYPRPTHGLRHAALTLITGLALAAGPLAHPAAGGTASSAPHSTRTPALNAPAPKTTFPAGPVPVKRACARPTHPNQMACLTLVRTDVTPHRGIRRLAAPSGLGPADLRAAYALPSSGGSGQTIAIIDAYDDPNAESDLATYRAQYGLPPCTSANGCFRKVDQNGGGTLPNPDPGWAMEISLDLDMASAICPNCRILLVEASQPYMSDLGTAVNTAVRLGATYISNSYGGAENPSDPGFDAAYFDHPGVAITVASGDDGYGVEYPAASRHVTAVGGTTLSRAPNTRGWNETVWKGSGSGCSTYDTKPSWQHDTGCPRRTVADVSAVADPATGVAVYDTYREGGWLVVGGTSASAPIIAGVYALAGPPAPGTYAAYPHQHNGALFDVTSGGNGTCTPAYLCTAGTGYDGPSGLGTPNGVTAFRGGTGNTVTVTAPGDQTSPVGATVGLQIRASDSAPGQTLTYSASGLPPGLAIDTATGLISGRPSTPGTWTVTVSAKDTTNASGSATFTWKVTPTGTCSAPGDKVTNGGFENGTAPWTTTAGVISANGTAQTARSGTHFAWLNGYGRTHTDTAAQTVTIPAGCRASLGLWLHIDTDESGGTAYDRLTIRIGGTVVAAYSDLDAAPGYQRKTFDLSAFAGKTVTLSFTGTEDASLQTSFVIDDVTLTAS